MPCKNHPFIDDRLTRCTRCGDSFCPDCIVQIGGYPYCAVCKDEAMRDLRSGLVAHQARPLELASLGRRVLAIWIDGLVLAIPLLILFFAIAIPSGIFKEVGKTEPSQAFIAFELLLGLGSMGFSIAYEGVMLSHGGQTVGKKLLGIKVVTPDGKDITAGQAWARAAVRQVLSMATCLGILLDYLFVLGEQRTCLHDLAARTRVVSWKN